MAEEHLSWDLTTCMNRSSSWSIFLATGKPIAPLPPVAVANPRHVCNNPWQTSGKNKKNIKTQAIDNHSRGDWSRWRWERQWPAIVRWQGDLAGSIGGGRHLGGTTWAGEGGGRNGAESMQQGTMWAGEVAGEGGRWEGADFKEGGRRRDRA